MENYESIDKALNISDTDIIPTKKEDAPKKNEVEKDYEYTRANLYSIIEKGQEAINGSWRLQVKVQVQEHMRLQDNL